MPRITTILLLVFACNFTARAQRFLETVRDPANGQYNHTAYGGKIMIAGHADSFMLSFADDVAFTRKIYPLLGGIRLKYSSRDNPLTHYGSMLYFALGRTAGGTTTQFLYRFNGSSFAQITTSGNIVSNCIVYGSFLYFLANVSGTTRLFRYNGTAVAEIAGSGMPGSTWYRLHVAGPYMYISGAGAMAPGPSNFIRRFSGTSFLTLPWSGEGTRFDSAFSVPGTSRVYFTSHGRILYYNGSTVTQVFSNTGESINPRWWRNAVYFTTGTESTPGVRTYYLFRLSGATVTSLTLPAGYQVAPVPHSNPEIYGDRLYIGATHTDGTKRVLQYDGTTFTSFFIIPTGGVANGIRLFLREGNLMIHPNYVNGTHAFEYNGTVFSEIIAPPDRLLFPYINSTACNHLWLNYYSDVTGIHAAIAKESKDCPAEPAPAIPDHFMEFEQFDITTYGPDRGWCWSEIIIDWDIEPVCPLPPCPDPEFELRMMDANNGVQWFEKFSKPSSFAVPLPDQQPFRTVLSSAGTKRDLLIFEPDLLPMGIEMVKVNIKPKQHYFLLTASTRNNMQVPFKATLLNANGQVLWEQTFIAPFSQQITATVQEPGKTLIFSIPNMGQKLITRTTPECPENMVR